MQDHPLLGYHITLRNGLEGLVSAVSDDEQAFVIETSEGSVEAFPDDFTGPFAIIARHHPDIAKIERGEGFTLDLSEVSDAEFDAFMAMTLQERHDAYGNFHSIMVTGLSEERSHALLFMNAPRE